MVQAMKSVADRMLGKLLREETAEASSGCLQYTGGQGCQNGVRCLYAWYSWNCAAQPQLVCVTDGGHC